MADQYEVVTRLLQTNGLADWHVVEPVSGDVRDYVWIQRADANRDMYVSIPVKRSDRRFFNGILVMKTFYVTNTQKGRILFCAPDGVISGQAARIVIKYLRDHPEELHQPDYALTIAALHAAFPCPNKK